jgi:two-component system, cell cycle sensor histidine kinase and response regulator CckA
LATVLVVEDDEMVRKLAAMTLRRNGYEVAEAEDGRKALQVLAEAKAPPQIVLLDLAMPVMGGDELAPILEEKYPEIKIVLTSGYPEEEARKIYRSASIASFLQKPYTVEALAERIAGTLTSAGGESG